MFVLTYVLSRESLQVDHFDAHRFSFSGGDRAQMTNVLLSYLPASGYGGTSNTVRVLSYGVEFLEPRQAEVRFRIFSDSASSDLEEPNVLLFEAEPLNESLLTAHSLLAFHSYTT